MNRLTSIAVLLATVALSCGGEDTETTTHLYPLSIEMRDAPGLDNRHHFEITGPDWKTPHTKIGDEVWNAGAFGAIDGDQVHGLSLDEPAPYTQGTPVGFHATFRWYEDWMFEKYCRKANNFCRGECDLDSSDERRHCVDNPPGLDEGDFEIIRGSNYR